MYGCICYGIERITKTIMMEKCPEEVLEGVQRSSVCVCELMDGMADQGQATPDRMHFQGQWWI